ncbi:acyl transferase-like protein [Trypanosoma rangeli SC58]|uniref:[acyl-carrier-protein] S-malonyltransferase n=1 Tax=Trypanosoma rangeli SC58 TaxID=429131 RepID=A0A061J064_TRYRA|nr:acyl transferase-like protein [Trypanosoma rangeli SC58]
MSPFFWLRFIYYYCFCCCCCIEAVVHTYTLLCIVSRKVLGCEEREQPGERELLKKREMKRALVFSGQGSHRRGMSMEYLRVPAVAQLWERMKCRMEQNYGISLQEVITENPQKIHVLEDALDINTLCQRSCLEERNVAESVPRRKVVSCSQGGVMLRTFLTQPCMVAAHMMALEYLRVTRGYSVEASSVIAGHSLGEFSALCALGVFSPEVAVDLVYKRGVFMEYAIDQFSANRDNYVIYACNPVRAKLCEDDPDVAVDQFHVLVELVARALSTTTSFVEVVNYNIDHEQYVVAGDRVGMSALGKCLDPQFRASVCGPSSPLDHIARTAVSSVWQDKKDGVTMDPNKGVSPDFVTSSVKKYGVRSTYRRFMRGPDDGYTPSLEVTNTSDTSGGWSEWAEKKVVVYPYSCKYSVPQ